ncbi:uncharacterized protein K452DRAFT_303069 [Aplosporella prunicola CBS 121167]|uniref:Amino acid permease/ SLC12A domain-containing protein n=1 Tax=Aplosporella prunicola CBS 121167 TaxID=1176127 RepID=A0A6A6AWF5_9PEZI|nr:uncharacterized protein K452DRAFT_303069 [Aplosporella prunicola CBS 121167]KAF2136050.1 hypothetical protein K452DRAFT_303069 [Aplosporella prunicola CBS 121167]
MHQPSETPLAGSVPSAHLKDPEKGLSKPLSRTNTAASVTEGTVANEGYGEYKAVFQTGATQVISLGSNMGSGLFVATGKALFIAGPGAMIFGYGFVTILVFCVLQTLAEMTIAFPVSGNLIDYADRWVDPALGFSAGFALWLGWVAVVGSEATVSVILINFWADGAVHQAVWLSLFLVFVFTLFCLPSQYFAWFEYVTSLIKIVVFLIFIVTSIAIVCGAGPTGKVHHGETWIEHPTFKGGFSGVGNAMMLAVWACGDQIFIGMMGAEAVFPRMAMGRAARMVTGRVIGVYMSALALISVLVPSDDSRLFGGSGAAASPFVIAVENAGIKGLPHLLNAVILIAAVSMACESIFIGSRALRALALQGLVSTHLANVDTSGRPRASLAITAMVSVAFTYINLSSTGAVIFGWFVSITSSSFFCMWIILAITSWRFRKALKVQNDPLFDRVYAWKCTAWPFTPLWLFLGCMVLVVACIYIGIYPNGSSDEVSVTSFFQSMIGLILIIASYIGYKLIFRTRYRNSASMDLITGRRDLSADEITQLDKYYSKPLWRRFLTYLQLW